MHLASISILLQVRLRKKICRFVGLDISNSYAYAIRESCGFENVKMVAGSIYFYSLQQTPGCEAEQDAQACSYLLCSISVSVQEMWSSCTPSTGAGAFTCFVQYLYSVVE